MTEIGIIGTGEMGKLYAREFDNLGYKVNCCDLPENRSQLEKDLDGTGVRILDDGVAVSRRSDVIFYLVPVEDIEKTVAQYGQSTRKDAVVSSGTSVMTPATEAFDRYLPDDVNVINWHWMFGPSLKPQGQNTALVRHRSNDEAYRRAREIFEKVGAKILELPSYQEHDRITADTQAVTHVGFESMGTAWKNMGNFPWESTTYVGGVDNVKVLMCLRIYGGKPHVYSGLAIHNPFARGQIRQYSQSVNKLFSLMIQEDEQSLRERIQQARNFMFSNGDSPILLDDKVMGEFSLGIPSEQRTPNSHLSLLAMADAWNQSGVNPYDNMICQTPPFRLRLGIVEYLLRTPELLEESIQTSLSDLKLRNHNLEFHTAVREWATIVGNGDVPAYHRQFESAREFFSDRIPEGMKKSGELIRRLSEAK